MKKIGLTIAAILIAYAPAFSQSVTETRRIKTTALQMYENYKVVVSDLYSKSVYTEDNFMALFERNALIYNDILPDNNPQQLSPSEYFKKFKASINRIYPVFSDFQLGEPVSAGNKWQIQCHFTRGTRFRTQNEMKYPEWSFNYIMTVEMDKSYNITTKVFENAKIISIGVDNPLKGFFIIENRENMSLVTKSGMIVKEWDEEYQSLIFPDDKWKISEINILKSRNDDNLFAYSKGKFTKNQTDAHFYQPKIQRFKKNVFGIGLNFSPWMSGFEMSDEHIGNFKGIEYLTGTAYAGSLSLFYGKYLTHKDKSTLFFNFGLDLNGYFQKDSCNNTINQRVGQSLQVKIDSLNENCSIVSVSVPLSLQYLYQLTQQANKPVFFSLELGVFVGAMFSRSKYNLIADYPEFKDAPGKYKLSGKESLGANFNSGIFGGIGLWFALNENNLLKFNISYKYGFNSPVKYDEEYMISENKDKHQSLLYSTNQGLQNAGIGISWVKTLGGK